jgi:hypothetical protein
LGRNHLLYPVELHGQNKSTTHSLDRACPIY